jgi:3-oxoacyl-[acyl-carrier protein] reductase
MDLGLKDRTALVVGGTTGLGHAVARRLSAEGVRVAITGRNRSRATDVAAEVTGGSGIGIDLDLADESSVGQGIAEVLGALGTIDVLVLGGGGPSPSVATDVTPELARSAAELLVHGPIAVIAACLPQMRERGWGRIVSIGSSAVHQPIRNLATSSIFRAALGSYLKLLAAEVAADGVTVNMVHPGRIATDRIESLDKARATREAIDVEQVRQESLRTIPAGRYGDPDEFAAVVAMLCGGPASYLTGEQIRVDGGMVGAL